MNVSRGAVTLEFRRIIVVADALDELLDLACLKDTISRGAADSEAISFS
jgi:hypothetical protein